MFFTEKNRKKNRLLTFLMLPFFCGVVFLFQTHFVEAEWQWWSPSNWVREILYAIFSMFGIFASLAITIFEWAIKPESIQTLMNNPGVYESWKFIRDFFNLFFILVLLYTAFSVVFQIEKNFKKTLLSIVLAALFINFSFPVSRALIDMTNVPMYFFANQMMARPDGNTDLFGQTFSASQLKHILLPQESDSDASRILMAIVFIFLFAVTLLVLSVMFVIRLVALVVLVMFSSVGFAASIIPGLNTYAKMWWDSFWKYAFFGPAAMLMLLVSVRVFASLGDGTANNVAGMNSTLIQSAGNVAGSTSNDTGFFAAMLLFTIPIIMLWMAMSLAQKFSIAGASSVVGQGQKVSRWMAKKIVNNTLTRGYGKGYKERAENHKFLKFVTPKYWSEASKEKEEQLQARASGVENAEARVIENQHNKKVAEAEKKMEEERISEAELRRRMNDRSGNTSDAEVEAAANILSKKDLLHNSADIASATNAITHANRNFLPDITREKTQRIVKKAGAEIYTTGTELAQAIGRLGTDTKAITALIDKASGNALNLSDAEYQNIITRNPSVQGKLDGKMRKEGQISTLVAVAASAPGGSARTAIQDIFDHMTAEEVAKQKIFTHSNYGTEAINYIKQLERSGSMEDIQRAQEIRKKLNKSVNDRI